MAMALLACFFISCSNDNEAADAVPADGTQVSFVLSLSNATNGTRATWSDKTDREDGDDYENRINPDDLHVLLYSTDNTCVATVKILSYTPTGDGDDYMFIGSVEPVNGGTLAPGTYKMMVFANCGDVISSSTDLNELSYIYVPDAVKSCDQYIPMWGVLTHDFRFEKGKRDDMGPIDLLRAFAKVEINLDETTSQQYTITSATLNKYNTQGYCLPAGYANAAATSDLEQESGSFHPFDSSMETILNFSPNGEGAYFLYVPEYDNEKNDAVIHLILTNKNDNGKTVSGDLKFTGYDADGFSDNMPNNIVRNHIYRYNVKVDLGKLIVSYSVSPWENVTSQIGWTPESGEVQFTMTAWSTKDVTSNAKDGDAEGTHCFVLYPRYKEKTSYNQYYLEEARSGAAYKFTLTAPEGAVWTAHLSNEEDFQFNYGSSNNGTNCVSTGIARDEPYQIKVEAKNLWTNVITDGTAFTKDENGKTSYDNWTEWGAKNNAEKRIPATYLYITVSLDGVHEEELVINPTNAVSSSNTYYKDGRRFAGTDTRIWIRQFPGQVPSTKNKEGYNYDSLAKGYYEDSKGNVTSFWWGDNPYWKY